MTQRYFVLVNTSGFIHQVVYTSGNIYPNSVGGYAVVQVSREANPETEYIGSHNKLTPRPTFDRADKTRIAANGTDATTINNLPTGTVVTIDETSWTVDDGIFVFRTNTPATYHVQVRRWPYQDYDVEITAT